MSDRGSLTMLLAYDDWANRAAFESLRGADAPAGAVRWFAHIVAAEHLWHDRLRGAPARLPVWPDLALEACREHLEPLGTMWRAYVDELDAGGLDRRVSYINSKGESWESLVRDVLTHVVIHSAYHRGQIAAAVRQAGGTPAYTDFIHAARQGLVE